jgi:hypothetical protein
MALEKKILRNKPYPLASGQYNYDIISPSNQINLGIDDENTKFSSATELYTTADNIQENRHIIDNVYSDSHGSSIQVNSIKYTKQIDRESEGLNKITVAFFDEYCGFQDRLDVEPPEDGPGTADGNYYMHQYSAGTIQTKANRHIIYAETNLVDGEGMGSYDLSPGGEFFKNFPEFAEYQPDFSDNADPDAIDASSVYFNSNLQQWYKAIDSYENRYDATEIMESNLHGFYYFLVWTQAGDLDSWWDGDSRKRLLYCFPIPKEILRTAWIKANGSLVTVAFSKDAVTGYGGNGDVLIEYKMPEGAEYGSGYAPMYRIDELVVTFKGPIWNENPTLSSLEGDYEQSRFVDVSIEDQYIFLNPNRLIDYTGIRNPLITNFDDPAPYLTNEDIPDFRPVSNIFTSVTNYDLQSYYENPEDTRLVTAPMVINLGFELAQNLDTFDINFLNRNNGYQNSSEVNEWLNFKYKFFVTNWDWKEGEPNNIEDIVNDFPTNQFELEQKQLYDNTFKYMELCASYDLSEDTVFVCEADNPADNFSSLLQHQYNTPGLKVIHSFVFSYAEDPDNPSLIQALRWKFVTIKLFIYEDEIYFEDFGELGSKENIFIPWPTTTAIISGISEQSEYYNTVSDVYYENKFYDYEALSRRKTTRAFKNLPGESQSELGEYVGKLDLAQTRYFSKPYSISDLLMIDVMDDGFFHSHQDIYNPENNPTGYWGNSEENQFPMESCVGLIFISEDVDKNRRNSVVFEFNYDNLYSNDRQVLDSSGGNYTGFLIGDYKLAKPDKGTSTYRNSRMKVPKLGTEDKAL